MREFPTSRSVRAHTPSPRDRLTVSARFVVEHVEREREHRRVSKCVAVPSTVLDQGRRQVPAATSSVLQTTPG